MPDDPEHRIDDLLLAEGTYGIRFLVVIPVGLGEIGIVLGHDEVELGDDVSEPVAVRDERADGLSSVISQVAGFRLRSPLVLAVTSSGCAQPGQPP